MGVLQCDRYGCRNIMCDITIMGNEYYICDDCYNELMNEKQQLLCRKDLTRGQIKKFIIDFMENNDEESSLDEDLHSFNGRTFIEILDERDRRDERWRDK